MKLLNIWYLPVWNTYLAKACMRVAGQVGGFVSPLSRFSRNVSSNPNPLGPSLVLHLKLWLKAHKKIIIEFFKNENYTLEHPYLKYDMKKLKQQSKTSDTNETFKL